jgi:hypothetical protein
LNLENYSFLCITYAYALRELRGFPLFILGGGHIVAKSPLGWMDEAGVRPIEAIAEDWGLNSDVDEFNESDYKDFVEWTHHGDWKDAVAQAQTQLRTLGL